MRIKKVISVFLIAAMMPVILSACAASSKYDIPELHISWDMTIEEAMKNCTVETTKQNDHTLVYLGSLDDKNKKPVIAGMTVSGFFLLFDEENGMAVKLIPMFEGSSSYDLKGPSVAKLADAFTKAYGEPYIHLTSKQQLTAFSTVETEHTYGWSTEKFVVIVTGTDNSLYSSPRVSFYPAGIGDETEQNNP